MGEKYEALKAHLSEITNLNRAGGILHWDQQTQMPAAAAAARGGQVATLSRIAHEMFTGDTTARLLEDAERETDGMPFESDEASLIRVVKQDYADAVKLPSSLVAELARAEALAHDVWAKARANNDFAAFVPALQRIVDLTIQVAECRGYDDQPYDALVDRYDRGMTTARVRDIFEGHKPQLVELIAAIRERSDRVSDAVLHQEFDLEKQRAFAVEVVKAFGYDFNRGRLDVAVHPFATHFSVNDVRITTRYTLDWLNPALFGTMHEAGHAMYEQGVSPALDGTPLGEGTSLAVHESQSRMWENIVGRSRAFWHWALPRLQGMFPNELGGVDLDTFYRAINKVQPSLIRVEADEATYNLHIMLRFELESALVAGKVSVANLPNEWNDRFEAYLGFRPSNDTLGVLQDVHWSMGLIGYFPTYALGNLLSAQYYRKAVQDRPSIADDIAVGKFDTLLSWLRENIHQHGRKFSTNELTERVTGEPIQSRDYIAYLQTKFSDVYGL